MSSPHPLNPGALRGAFLLDLCPWDVPQAAIWFRDGSHFLFCAVPQEHLDTDASAWNDLVTEPEYPWRGLFLPASEPVDGSWRPRRDWGSQSRLTLRKGFPLRFADLAALLPEGAPLDHSLPLSDWNPHERLRVIGPRLPARPDLFLLRVG